MEGGRGGGVVVALQNEFTEIFIYNFFLRFLLGRKLVLS